LRHGFGGRTVGYAKTLSRRPQQRGPEHFVRYLRGKNSRSAICGLLRRLGGGGCSRRLNRLCQGFPVSGNYTGNLSAFSARDLTVSGEKHRIKQRFYPVEVTARGSGTANSGQIIREFRSNCRDSPGSISRVPCLPALALNSRQPPKRPDRRRTREGEGNRAPPVR
jgi:hypothetical protein